MLANVTTLPDGSRTCLNAFGEPSDKLQSILSYLLEED